MLTFSPNDELGPANVKIVSPTADYGFARYHAPLFTKVEAEASFCQTFHILLLGRGKSPS